MPQITSSPVLSPNSSAPFTGAIVLSKTQGGCGNSGNCVIAIFRDGLITEAYTYSAYATSPIAISLPVSIASGTVYYNVISGDPALIVCDPSRLCGTMPYAQTIGETNITWGQFADLRPAPVLSNDLYYLLAQTQADLKTSQRAVSLLQARVKALQTELANCKKSLSSATTAPTVKPSVQPSSPLLPTGETLKLISQIDLSCPPPEPVTDKPTFERKPSTGCCGEVDSVAGFIEKAGDAKPCP